jgi:cytochrome c556
MNRITTTLATIALTFAAAGSAFADDITMDTANHASLKTRAEVQQELAQFKKGANPWSTSYNVNASTQSERSRADVRAEVLAARASGELAALASEDSGSAYLAQHQQAAPTVSRMASL